MQTPTTAEAHAMFDATITAAVDAVIGHTDSRREAQLVLERLLRAVRAEVERSIYDSAGPGDSIRGID